MALDLNALRNKTSGKPKTPAVVKPRSLAKVAASNPKVAAGKKPSGIKLSLGTRKKLEPKAKLPEPEPVAEIPIGTPVETPAEVSSPLGGETPTGQAPAEVDKSLMSQQERFLANINQLDAVIHDKDLLGSVLSDIMLELSENPDYKKFMADSHLETMMRGMMETFAVVKASKAKKTPAKKTARGRKAKPISAEAQKMLDQMKPTEDGKLDLDALMGITL